MAGHETFDYECGTSFETEEELKGHARNAPDADA